MDIFWNHTILPFFYNGYLYKMPLFVVSFEFCQTFDVFFPKILSWFSFNLSWLSLTVGISALLVMAVVLYHSLTGQALNDILNLIWLHCLLQSINALKNYFCDLSWPLVFHWYCSHCYMLVDKKDKHCPNSFCLKDFTVLGSLSFFVEVPTMEQLRKFYSKPGFY